MKILRLSIIFLFVFLLFPNFSYAKNIGWIADIHADDIKTRNSNSKTGNTQEPKNFGENFNSVSNELKNKSINTVIVSGDMVNNGERKYAAELKKIAKNHKLEVLWVKGNHDTPETMKEFGLSNKYYYFKDYDNLRIIVLDNTEIYNDYWGGMRSEQIVWLQQALQTSKEVMISMHIPIFSGADDGRVVLDRYKEFENIISTSGNVKLVLFGHYHENFEKEINGVKYKILQPLTKRKENRSYGILDSNDYSVRYLQAKSVKYKSADEKKAEEIKPRTIKNNKTKKRNGEFLTLTGKNFSEKSTVQLFFSKAGGGFALGMTVVTDKKGKFSVSSKIANKLPGKHSWYALDSKKHKKSKSATYVVTK